MENLFLNILKQAKKQKKLISIYTDKDNTDKFSAGYVNDQIEEGVFLQSIDPNGFDDGIIFLNIDNIYIIDYDNKYLANLEQLHKNRDKLQAKNTFTFKRSEGKCLIEDVFNKCKDEKILITVKLIYDVGVTGFVKDLNEDDVCVNVITDDGEQDGLTYFKIEDVDRIYLDGIDQKRINILLSKKK
jgi:hypothetical protein